jgi:hypothetical protein
MPVSKTHICTTCLSVCEPTGGAGGAVGGLLMMIAVLVALTTHDANAAIAVTPLTVAGATMVIRSHIRCPICWCEGVVPLSSPRGHALVPEALREATGGS